MENKNKNNPQNKKKNNPTNAKENPSMKNENNLFISITCFAHNRCIRRRVLHG